MAKEEPGRTAPSVVSSEVATAETQSWPFNLVDIFVNGLFVTWHKYDNDSDQIRKLWNCSKREDQNNKLDYASVVLIIESTKPFVDQYKDGASKKMVEVFGR